MANTTEDPVGVVVDAPSGVGDGLAAPAAPAPPDIVNPISATAATADAPTRSRMHDLIDLRHQQVGK